LNAQSEIGFFPAGEHPLYIPALAGLGFSAPLNDAMERGKSGGDGANGTR
jgi:hypothetical protein